MHWNLHMCNAQLSCSSQPSGPQVLCRLISDQISMADTLNQGSQKDLRKLPGSQGFFS